MEMQDLENVLTRKVNKWKPTGLLYGLNETQARDLVTVLEHTAQYLLTFLEDSKETNRNVDIIFPIVRKIYEEVEFGSVSLPAYLDKKNQVRTIQPYKTNVDVNLNFEPMSDEIDRVCEGLLKFFEDKMGDKCYVSAYSFILNNTDDPNMKTITFRGNFLEKT